MYECWSGTALRPPERRAVPDQNGPLWRTPNTVYGVEIELEIEIDIER